MSEVPFWVPLLVAIIGFASTIFVTWNNKQKTTAETDFLKADATDKITTSAERIIDRLEKIIMRLEQEKVEIREELQRLKREFEERKAECYRKIADRDESIAELQREIDEWRSLTGRLRPNGEDP